MNKTGFIKELENKLNYDNNKCTIINSVLEDNFIFGKKNKIKIINGFMEKLNIEEEEANNIYNVCNEIMTTQIKNKIKHPFRSEKK